MCSSNVGPLQEGEAALDAALARLADAVDDVAALDLDSLEGDRLLERLRSFETVSWRVDSVGIGLADRVDRTRAHRLDGHMNATAFVRHACRVSGSEASGRVRSARALRDLPAVAVAHRSGALPTGHLGLFANVWSNPRVRELLPLAEEPLLASALVSSHRDFSELIRQWERLADVDGAHRANEAAHRRRDFRLQQGFDDSWDLRGNLSAAMGAAFSDVFEHFAALELEIDWDKARAEHGDEACHDDLPRTAAQRRADALFHLAQAAATVAPGRQAGDPLTSIVIDKDTFDEEVARLAGCEVEPDVTDFAQRRCSTMTGHRVHPRDAVLAALYGKLRRVVVGADGAVIDLGKAARFFTGNARTAALLAHPECTHPGCETPSQRCEADHMIEWSKHGLTDATTNGNPRCGFHNKLKNHGYRTWREPDGTWLSARPDGTPIL